MKSFLHPFILMRASQTKCWIKVQQRHVRVTSPILLFVVFYFTTTLSCFDAQKMKKMMTKKKKKKTKGQGVQKAAWMRDFKGAYACALERSMASNNPSVWAADGGFWD